MTKAFLIDTHVVLWWLGSPTKIVKNTRKIIEDNASLLFLSSASIWEISIKVALKRLNAPDDVLTQLQTEDIRVLPISGEHATYVSTLPLVHRDPFDRMLIAQALLEDLTLVTRDEMFSKYSGLKVIEA